MTRSILCGVLFLLVTLPAAPAASAAARPALPVRPAATVDARVALDAYEALVESELQSVLAGLKTAAATEEARSGDWARVRAPLAALAGETPVAAAVWMARPDGAYFTLEKGAVGESLADREYFPVLLAGRDVEGQLVVSHSTGARSIIVAAPVMADGKVVGALGVSVSADKLAALVEQQIRLPQSIGFYALDAQGRTALHRQAALIFERPAELESPSLRTAVRTMLSRPEGVVRYRFRGKGKTVVFRRSAKTGWVFALAVERGDAPPRR